MNKLSYVLMSLVVNQLLFAHEEAANCDSVNKDKSSKSYQKCIQASKSIAESKKESVSSKSSEDLSPSETTVETQANSNNGHDSVLKKEKVNSSKAILVENVTVSKENTNVDSVSESKINAVSTSKNSNSMESSRAIDSESIKNNTSKSESSESVGTTSKGQSVQTIEASESSSNSNTNSRCQNMNGSTSAGFDKECTSRANGSTSSVSGSTSRVSGSTSSVSGSTSASSCDKIDRSTQASKYKKCIDLEANSGWSTETITQGTSDISECSRIGHSKITCPEGTYVLINDQTAKDITDILIRSIKDQDSVQDNESKQEKSNKKRNISK